MYSSEDKSDDSALAASPVSVDVTSEKSDSANGPLPRFDTVGSVTFTNTLSNTAVSPRRCTDAEQGGRFPDRTSTIDRIKEAKRHKQLPPLSRDFSKTLKSNLKIEATRETWKVSHYSLHTWSQLVPLVAAVLAPISTLYDIPGLTETWYCYAGAYVSHGPCDAPPDFTGSLYLSAWGLAFNIVGNGMLIFRFSDTKYWHLAAHLSNIAWLAKLAIALVNVLVYGAGKRNDPQFEYNEGFWAAIISVILAGLISIILTFHTLVDFFVPMPPEKQTEDPKAIRATGKRFMISTQLMDVLLGLMALLFSKVEGWTFLQGLYFSVVTGFTIGYGDFEPTYNVTRVLLFFFAVATITYLANQVSMIVTFIQGRTAQRRIRWRREFQEAAQLEEDLREPNLDLAKEIVFLEALAQREELVSQLYDLMWSFIYLVGLLLIGAAAFSSIEGLAYGTALYFTYVTVLTIGYGDISPQTAAGRCFWIIFAFTAVPIVTSFAVQSVTGLVGALANGGLDDEAESLQEDRHHDAFKEHEEIVGEHSFHVDRRMSHVRRDLDAEDTHSLRDDEEKQRELHRRLTVATLTLALQLEEQARLLLISQLKLGSREQTLLRADLHIQTKVREALWKEHKSGALEDLGPATEHNDEFKELHDKHPIFAAKIWATGTADNLDLLKQIGDYRKTFAQLLAVGSKLLKLDGVERHHFERRMTSDLPRTATQVSADRRAGEIGDDIQAAVAGLNW